MIGKDRLCFFMNSSLFKDRWTTLWFGLLTQMSFGYVEGLAVELLPY